MPTAARLGRRGLTFNGAAGGARRQPSIGGKSFAAPRRCGMGWRHHPAISLGAIPVASEPCSVSAAHHVSVAAQRPWGEGTGEFPGILDSCPVGVTKTRTRRRNLVYLSITVE